MTDRHQFSFAKTFFSVILSFFLFTSFCYAFDSELWPGEGIPSFRARQNLNLYKQPSTTSSPIKDYTIKSGQQIIYKDTRVRTIKPGAIKAIEPVTIRGRSFGPIEYLKKDDYYAPTHPEKIFSFQKGDSFEYLQERAEGSVLIRVKGEVIEAELGNQFVYESQPVNEWWVSVINKNNKVIGWLLINKENIEFLERKF